MKPKFCINPHSVYVANCDTQYNSCHPNCGDCPFITMYPPEHNGFYLATCLLRPTERRVYSLINYSVLERIKEKKK